MASVKRMVVFHRPMNVGKKIYQKSKCPVAIDEVHLQSDWIGAMVAEGALTIGAAQGAKSDEAEDDEAAAKAKKEAAEAAAKAAAKKKP